jgi:hypothetical protein
VKNSKTWLPTLFVFLLLTLLSLSAYAQITPSGDAYTNTASPSANYGSKPLLDVESASQTTYIQFDLSSIPAGYTSANVAKASLKLYVNAVTTAGSFNVNFVNGTWSEKTITANNAPAMGATIAASVPLTTANKNDYILIDITPAVGAWLDGSQANDGIALVANSPLNASFDSKESTTNSQPAELDVALTGNGTGTITGVTTASGSGLTGGGTKGTLALGLTKTCAANQGLQWNGSAWICSSAGTGTITGITTASGSGLQGGGTSGTLNLSVNPAVVPELGAANTFTNTNTVSVSSNSSPALTLANHTGNGLYISDAGTTGIYIASTGNGIVMASVIGDGIDIQGAAATGISAIGQNDGGYFNGRVAGSYAQNDVDGAGSAAAYGYETGSTNITYGVVGYSASNKGIGTYGQAVSASAEGSRIGGFIPLGIWGDSGALGDSVGVFGSADQGSGVIGINNSDLFETAGFENDETSDSTASVLRTSSGGFGGICNINVSGDLFCTGTKSAVVPVDGGARKVALYAVESPENWFEDFGSGQLSNGAVSITLEPTFRQTVNTDTDYHVFLTPNGDSRGLYIAQKTPTTFEVREQGGGTSSVAFDYRIVARRNGYERIRLADKTKEMNVSRPKRAERRRAVLPTELGKRNRPEAHLHPELAKPVVNTR